MCGRETLTTVVSRTSMKVPNITATATIQGLTCGCADAGDAMGSLLMIGRLTCGGCARVYALAVRRHACHSFADHQRVDVVCAFIRLHRFQIAHVAHDGVFV